MGEEADVKVIAFITRLFSAKQFETFPHGQSPSSPVGPDL